ncbi:hypothetical protein pipiens_017543 [Culex pipiens pipiens]|uniref:Uncharacterized protein n=1 Tax=Culex pipiens pipiens TaxID=38569 RepID=A0ABD1CG59_CULPP
MFSSNPNTSKREKKATRKALEKLKKKGDKVFTGNSESSDDSDEEDSDEKDSDEKDSDEKDSDEGDSDERDSDEDDSENEKESSDDTVRANRNTSTSKQVKKKPKRNKKKVEVLSARTVKMLMKHMESMIEQKLSRLDLGKNSKSVKHTANPVKEKRSKQRTKPGKKKNKRKPTDDSSEDSEVTESSDEDVARTLRRRPRSVADWKKYNKPETRPWKAADSGTKPNWKGTQGSSKPPAFRPPTQERNENQGSSAGTLEKRVQNYRVPDKMVCFNCRGRNHHFEVCMMPKEVFCTVCGFHDYPKEKCPFCLKNGRTSV